MPATVDRVGAVDGAAVGTAGSRARDMVSRMNENAERILKSELGGTVPHGMGSLTEADMAGFAAVLHDAKDRQSRELQDAVDQALEIVPRLLRGTIRRILFG
jgi:hypothetical protein